MLHCPLPAQMVRPAALERKISILLIRFPDTAASLLSFLTRFRYTHASIGLSEDLNTFYSFVNKGFIKEKITRYLKPGREPFPCALYEIDVSKKVYRRIKKLLQAYERRKKFLHYTHLSVVLSYLKIPFKRKDRYFCSHFVAEVLQRARAIRLPKNSVLYLPKDFHNLRETRMIYQGDLQGMAQQFALTEGNP